MVRMIRPGQVPLIDLENPPHWTETEWFRDRENTSHIDEPFHRGRLLKAGELVVSAVQKYGSSSLVDIGCGDGGLLRHLKPKLPAVQMRGYDAALPSIAASKLNDVDVFYRNLLEGDLPDADLAVCTEFLEHLVDPHSFVQRMSEVYHVVVASSPFTETIEHHYPLHTWAFDTAGYTAMFQDAGYVMREIELVDMFQVLLLVRG